MEPPRRLSPTETPDLPHTLAKNYANFSTSDKISQLSITLKQTAPAREQTKLWNNTFAYSAEHNKTIGTLGYHLHSTQRTHGQAQQLRKLHSSYSWATRHVSTNQKEAQMFQPLEKDLIISKKPGKLPKRHNVKRKKPGSRTNHTNPLS